MCLNLFLKALICHCNHSLADLFGLWLGREAESHEHDDGREQFTQVQELAVSVIAHRIVLDSQARFSGVTAEHVVSDLLKTIPAPS